MILYLTDSLRIKENDSPEYIKLLKHSLRNIAVAATNNYHSIFGDLDILTECVDLFKGDDELYGLFRHIADNWYSTPVPSCISYYIEVVRNAPSERTEGNRTISQRVIGDFCESFSTIPCQLVCEDAADCSFYKFMVDWYIRHNNIRANVRYIEDACGGCGHALDKVVYHLRLKQICLCILDSDKSYPEKDINKNAKDCMKIDNRVCGYRCVVLNVHEIENLLPHNYVVPATEQSSDYKKYQSVRDQVQHFKYLMQSPKSLSIFPYYDLKDGVKCIPEVTSNVDHMRFAEMCWNEDPALSTGTSFANYVSGIQRGNSICYRLSKAALEDTLNYIDGLKAQGSLVAPNLLAFQAQEWERISQNLLSWGYSSSIEAVS